MEFASRFVDSELEVKVTAEDTCLNTMLTNMSAIPYTTFTKQEVATAADSYHTSLNIMDYSEQF